MLGLDRQEWKAVAILATVLFIASLPAVVLIGKMMAEFLVAQQVLESQRVWYAKCLQINDGSMQCKLMSGEHADLEFSDDASPVPPPRAKPPPKYEQT